MTRDKLNYILRDGLHAEYTRSDDSVVLYQQMSQDPLDTRAVTLNAGNIKELRIIMNAWAEEDDRPTGIRELFVLMFVAIGPAGEPHSTHRRLARVKPDA